MQYLVLTLFIGISTAACLWVIFKVVKLKRLFLQKILTKKIINRGIFSTLAIKELSGYILRQSSANRQKLLQNLNQNNFSELIENINNPQIAAKLSLMYFNRRTNPDSEDVLYRLMTAAFFLKKQGYDKAAEILQKIKGKKLSKGLKAYFALLSAQIALFEADLQTATEDAGRALKIFQKENLLFEEASAYYLLGTAYRVSGVFDAADFMLRSARKIFHFIGAASCEAEVFGTLGLLMSVQKRFDEADAYFKQAAGLFSDINDKTNYNFIICQQAMAELLQNNASKAKALALKILRKKTNAAVLAFAADIVGRAAFSAGKWAETAKYASLAAEKYLKQKNYAAVFECRYLWAEALVRQNNPDKAEAVLRKLIGQEKYHKSCFHIANAYTLLGLIFLRKNDIKRAKTIFNQALTQELHNDRAAGIAIDYANLVLIEKKCGNMEEARKNLEQALFYAKEADEGLYNRIKAALD